MSGRRIRHVLDEGKETVSPTTTLVDWRCPCPFLSRHTCNSPTFGERISRSPSPPLPLHPFIPGTFILLASALSDGPHPSVVRLNSRRSSSLGPLLMPRRWDLPVGDLYPLAPPGVNHHDAPAGGFVGGGSRSD